MRKAMRGYTMISALGLMMCILTLPVHSVMAQPAEQEIKIQAKRFAYQPAEITLKKDVPVILELTSLDVHHGFNCPDLGLRTDIYPGRTTTLRVVPDKTGNFPFHCDVYCGDGHEDMAGVIMVTE